MNTHPPASSGQLNANSEWRQKWWHKIIALLLILICLWAMFEAATRGVADSYAEDAYSITQDWTDETFTAESWYQVRDLMETAHWLDGSNPAFNHRMGSLYHIGMNLIALDDKEARSQMALRAQRHFRLSVDVRPAWGFTWASWALLKRDLGEFDSEMDTILANATRYGPWEPEVHHLITEVGLSAWGSLEEESRRVVSANVMRGLRSPVTGSAQKVLNILKKYSLRISGLSAQPLWDAFESGLLGDSSNPWKVHQTIIFSEITLMYWNNWQAENRSRLIDILESHKGDAGYIPRLFKLAKTHNKLPLVCAFVSRDATFNNYCSTNQ